MHRPICDNIICITFTHIIPSLFFKLSSLLLNIRPFKLTAEQELYQNPVPSFAAQLSSSIDSQNSFSSSSNFIFPFAPNDLGLKKRRTNTKVC